MKTYNVITSSKVTGVRAREVVADGFYVTPNGAAIFFRDEKNEASIVKTATQRVYAAAFSSWLRIEEKEKEK